MLDVGAGEDWSAMLIGGGCDRSGTVCGVVEPEVGAANDEELEERNGLAQVLRKTVCSLCSVLGDDA